MVVMQHGHQPRTSWGPSGLLNISCQRLNGLSKDLRREFGMVFMNSTFEERVLSSQFCIIL